METLRHIHTLSSHVDRIWCLSWNYNGSLLASCSGDKTIRIWTYFKCDNRWECICVLDEQHTKTIRCIAWSPCGNYLASAGFDGLVCIEKLVTRNPIQFQSVTTLESHKFEIKSVSWSTSGNYLATCARDKTVQLWELDDYESPECVATFDSHTQDVKSVKWHPVVEMLVSSSYDNTIKIYREELDEWCAVSSLNGHLSTVWTTEFNCDGTVLASCSDDKSLRLWVALAPDFSNWLCVSVLEGYHTGTVFDLCWAPCSNLLCSVGADNSIFIFRISGEDSVQRGDASAGLSVELVSRVTEAHGEDINTCAWQPGVRGAKMVLATASDDTTIKMWQFCDPDMPID